MNATELNEEGWLSVDSGYIPLSTDRIVEFARDEAVYRQLPWFGKWADFRPESNVAGLWWRPV